MVTQEPVMGSLRDVCSMDW